MTAAEEEEDAREEEKARAVRPPPLGQRRPNSRPHHLRNTIDLKLNTYFNIYSS